MHPKEGDIAHGNFDNMGTSGWTLEAAVLCAFSSKDYFILFLFSVGNIKNFQRKNLADLNNMGIQRWALGCSLQNVDRHQTVILWLELGATSCVLYLSLTRALRKSNGIMSSP